jgi:hypothetical protein
MLVAKQVQASRALFMVTDACASVGSSIIGVIERGSKLTGPTSKSGRTGNAEDIKDQAANMKENVNTCFAVINSRIEALTNTARFSTTWHSEAEGLKKMLVRTKGRLPMRPDWLLTERGLQKKEEMLAGVVKAVVKFVEKFEEQVAKCGQEIEIDYEAMKLQCYEMARVLAYSPTLQTWENEALQKALEARRIASEKLATANSEYHKHKKEFEFLKSDISSMGDMWMLRRKALDGKVDSLCQSKRRLGSGKWVMNGEPPRDDPVAQEQYRFWMSKQWGKLRPYTSGNFSVKLDTNLTPAQRDAESNYKKAVDELDQAKKDFNKKIEGGKSRMYDLEHVKMPQLKDIIKEAEEELNKLVANGDGSWEAFMLKHPIEYAQITLLYEVSENVGKVSEWMVSVDEPASRVSQLMGLLKYEEDPTFLLETIEELIEMISNPQESSVAFLKNYGEYDLKRLMKPKGKHVETADWNAALQNEMRAISVD